MGILKKFHQDLDAALSATHAAAFRQVLSEHAATMTFADLATLLATPVGRELRGLRVADIYGTPHGTASPATKGAERKPAKVTAHRVAAPDPRQTEIDVYGVSVLQAVRDARDWVASGALLQRVGGDQAGLRDALLRLVETGLVLRQGERAQTRYRAAE